MGHARQGAWPNLPERSARVSELLGEPCGASKDYFIIKETKLVGIDIISSMDIAVVVG
jgi:hypothetical protein